jgi:hypothetical protein
MADSLWQLTARGYVSSSKCRFALFDAPSMIRSSPRCSARVPPIQLDAVFPLAHQDRVPATAEGVEALGWGEMQRLAAQLLTELEQRVHSEYTLRSKPYE